MFMLQPAATFRADVPLSVPGLPAISVVVTYRHKGRTALDAWLQHAEDNEDAAVLIEVIENIEGLTDAAGTPVPFTPAILATLIENYPVSHRELFAGYLKELARSKVPARN